jgi:CubicO group peptidase (beta-lactamase class C family)
MRLHQYTCVAVGVVVIGMCTSASAQTSEGQSSDAAARTARIDRIFAPWDKPDSPGCALAVVKDGHVVYQHGYGSANLDYNVPITPESVFYIASLSKQFVAASVALLAQQGKLSLDDDVREYVPELPDYGHTITIQHLVHHTSGLRDYLTLMQLAGMRWEDVHSEQEILELVCRQKGLNFAPGEKFRYCNTGYLLLAEIVHRVSGRTLRQFAQQEIFRPLGMVHSHFHDDSTHVVPNRAISYAPAENGTFRVNYLANWNKVGSGGLLSTAEDLARWDRNFYDKKLGGEEFVKTLHCRGTLNDGTVLPYAFGLVIGEYRGLKTVSHGGSFMGFRTVLMRFPEQTFSVIILANLADVNPTALAQEVAKVYLAEPLREHLADYCGGYTSDELAATYCVRLEGADLVVKRPAAGATPLSGDGKDDVFGLAGMEVKFSRDSEKHVTGFVLNAGNADGIWFVRDE